MTTALTQLGRYRILREIGRGAMGVVYLAQDDSLQRQVAIKTLLAPEDAPDSAQHVARFLQEAKAAGGQNHPNIITIYDLGREGELLYIAMEFLDGQELRDRMAAGRLPLHEALDIAAQVGAGLAAAHAHGVVHRDIKPGNIMVMPDGHAKIMDFGIARMQSSDVRTQSGTMMGSPKYMSPEQVGGHMADHRSDVFSLGSVLYEMVTGQTAFSGNNLGELLSAILHGTPTPVTQLDAALPEAVQAVIARAMQKNPANRYQDAGEMARELARCRAAVQHAATEPVAMAVDLYAATAAVERTVVARPGLPPAAAFDSSLALQRMLRGELPAKAPRRRSRWKTVLWLAAYLLAGAGAAAIAFGPLQGA